MNRKKTYKMPVIIFLLLAVTAGIIGLYIGKQNGNESETEGTEQERNYVVTEESSGADEIMAGDFEWTQEGEALTPDTYTGAYLFNEGLGCACKDGKYGFIGTDGETVIPFIYDRATPFVEGLAYFCKGDSYGFMDKTGEVCFYLDCDSVSTFQEGLAFICVDGKYGYIDQKGQIAIEAKYDDADYFKGGFAKVMEDGYYGMIDRTGKYVIAPEYTGIERSEAFFIAEKDEKYEVFDREGQKLPGEPCDWADIRDGTIGREVKTQDVEKEEISDTLLVNEITPRADGFYDFMRTGVFAIYDRDGRESVFSEWDGFRIVCRLYDLRHTGESILYICAKPYHDIPHVDFYSGFFENEKGDVICLLSGKASSGGEGGSYMCFWYDMAEKKLFPGKVDYEGWFGDSIAHCYIYDVPGEEADSEISFGESIRSSEGYGEEYLRENEGFLYDSGGQPYTGESMTQNIYEYFVNGEHTTVEHYREMEARYRYVELPR